MTKTIKELLDELKDLERHTHRGLWWVRLDKVESLISEVEALVREETVSRIKNQIDSLGGPNWGEHLERKEVKKVLNNITL